MLSEQQLEEYRRMTPGERIALSLDAFELNWPWLMHGTKDHVDRKFELLSRTNDQRNVSLLDQMGKLVEQR